MTNLETALLATDLVEIIRSDSKAGKTAILLRVSKEDEPAWLELVDKILSTITNTNTELHVCRRYLLVEGNLKFAWNLEIRSGKMKAVKDAESALVTAVSTFRPSEPPPPVAPVPTKRSQPIKSNSPQVARAPLPRRPATVGYTEAKDKTKPHIKLIRDEIVTNDQGRPVRVQEVVIPLAHVSARDRNIPTKPRWDPEKGRMVGGHRGARLSH